MNKEFEKTVREYNNIEDDIIILNGWKNQNCFPAKTASISDRELLKKIAAIEISFDGTGGDSTKFDALFKKFEDFLEKLLFAFSNPTYLFKSEFKSQLSNRIRTYKGILPVQLLTDLCSQEELNLENGKSIIAALVQINSNNISICKDFFYDSDTSFIIMSRNLLNRKIFIKDVVENKMVHNSTSFVNYLRVTTDYCINGDLILRIGGDGGDRYVSLQIFYLKDSANYILEIVNASLLDKVS